MPLPMGEDVARAFEDHPSEIRSGLLALRALIIEVADDVGASPLTESLKWGQPSYRAHNPHQSTPVRVGSTPEGHYGLFFHCQSSVVPEFRAMFPSEFRYDGSRGILFRPGDDHQAEKLRLCIAHALRYRS